MAADSDLPQQQFAGSMTGPEEGVEVNISVLTSLSASNEGLRRGSLPQPVSRFSKCKLRTKFAALGCLAAVVLLVFVCQEYKARVVIPGIMRRTLSVSRDSGSELERVCTEGALGSDSALSLISVSEQVREDPSEPTAKKAKLATDEREGGSTSQPVSLGDSDSDAAALKPSPSTKSEQRAEFSEATFQPRQGRHAMKRPAHQQAHASAHDPGGVSSGTPVPRSAEELEAASSLLLLQTREPRGATAPLAAASGLHIEKQSGTSAAEVDPGASNFGVQVPRESPSGIITSQPLSVLKLPPLVFSSADGQQPATQKSSLSRSSSEGSSQAVESPSVERWSTQQSVLPSTNSAGPSQAIHGQSPRPWTTQQSALPSTSSALPLQEAEGQAEKLEHHFVRLPVLLARGPYSQLLDPQAIVSQWTGRYPTRICISYEYENLAMLLTQETLSSKEVEWVAGLAGELMGSIMAHKFAELSIGSRRRRAVTMAHRFLALDALVSALQILGIPRKGPWWDQLIDRVPHSCKLPEAKASDSSFPLLSKEILRRKFTLELLRQLHDAIGTLKGGNRPDNQTLIDLNKKLFFHEFSPSIIQNSRWNIWRRVVKDSLAGN